MQLLETIIMADVFNIDTLEQLKPFVNKDNFMEIVIRGQNNKFKAFQKVAFNDLPQNEAKQLAQQAINAMGENKLVGMKHLQLVQHISQAQHLGLLLNGLNLAATAAGFAIMYAKLDSMSQEINRGFRELHQTIKQGYDVQSAFEFDKVLAEYTDMLDCRRKQQPYSEDKMRKLVDQIYTVLNLLIEMLQRNITINSESIITSIFSLLSMLTVSLKIFDEQYYFNNKDVLSDQIVWHSSHDRWMSPYDRLNSKWFAERLQDYAYFETALDALGVDVYYIELMNQIMEMRQEVEDNQELITLIDDTEIVKTVRESVTQDIRQSIETVLTDTFSDRSVSELQDVYDQLMKQAALL